MTEPDPDPAWNEALFEEALRKHGRNYDKIIVDPDFKALADIELFAFIFQTKVKLIEKREAEEKEAIRTTESEPEPVLDEALFEEALRKCGRIYDRIIVDPAFKALADFPNFRSIFESKVKLIEKREAEEKEAIRVKVRALNVSRKDKCFRNWDSDGCEEYLEDAVKVHGEDGAAFKAIDNDPDFVLLSNVSERAKRSKWQRMKEERKKTLKRNKALEKKDKSKKVGDAEELQKKSLRSKGKLETVIELEWQGRSLRSKRNPKNIEAEAPKVVAEKVDTETKEVGQSSGYGPMEKTGVLDVLVAMLKELENISGKVDEVVSHVKDKSKSK